MSFEFKIKGHCDIYEYPSGLQTLNFVNEFLGNDQNEKEVRATAYLEPPMTFFDDYDNGNFSIFGPLYSLVKETAIYGNWRYVFLTTTAFY